MSKYSELKRLALQLPKYIINSDQEIFIFGAGQFGRDLYALLRSHKVKVSGFVETLPKSSNVLNIPVLNWSAMIADHPNAKIVVGIFNRDTPYSELVKIAASAGFHNLIMPWDIYDQFGSSLGWRYWLGPRTQILENLDRMEGISCQLADEESKTLLFRVIAFRLGLDLAYSNFRSNEVQYFNDLSLQRFQDRPIIYVDCGAYNGDTFHKLISNMRVNCSRAFLLEPDLNNYSELVTNTAQNPNAVCLPLAVSSQHEILRFNGNRGEAGVVSDHGTSTITSVSLDEIFPSHHVDLIKLDIEGAEMAALMGSKILIKRCRPTLVLSLYHKPNDLWDLTELVLNLCFDYRLYLRQHFFNSFDLNLYCIPR